MNSPCLTFKLLRMDYFHHNQWLSSKLVSYHVFWYVDYVLRKCGLLIWDFLNPYYDFFPFSFILSYLLYLISLFYFKFFVPFTFFILYAFSFLSLLVSDFLILINIIFLDLLLSLLLVIFVNVMNPSPTKK